MKYSIYWYNFQGKLAPCLIQGSFIEIVDLAKDFDLFVNKSGRKYIIKEVPPIDKPKYIGYY